MRIFLHISTASNNRVVFYMRGTWLEKTTYYFKPTLKFSYGSQDQWNLLQVYVLPPMTILAKMFVRSGLSCFNLHDDKKIIWDHFLKKSKTWLLFIDELCFLLFIIS